MSKAAKTHMYGEQCMFRATSHCGLYSDEQWPDNYFHSWEYGKITCKKCLVKYKKIKENEIVNYSINNRAIKKATGWKPETSLIEGLRKII